MGQCGLVGIYLREKQCGALYIWIEFANFYQSEVPNDALMVGSPGVPLRTTPGITRFGCNLYMKVF